MYRKILAFTSLIVSLTSHAALYDRGNGMIYDDVLDITWLQDSNYAQTSGYHIDGHMTWGEANTWAAQLVYGGYDDWRLPSARLMNPAFPCFADDGSCDQGYNITTSELGHMFYNNLGNQAYIVVTWPPINDVNTSFTDAVDGDTVSFLNLEYDGYGGFWYEEEFALSTNRAWDFHFLIGMQGSTVKSGTTNAWAVRDGDVAAVPVPAAAWLFGSALIGMISLKSRKGSECLLFSQPANPTPVVFWINKQAL